MTGYFRISNEEKLIKHDHLIFYFESRLLIFNDIRKFGFIKFYKPQEVFSSSHLSTIGPEPFFQRNMILIILKIIQKKKTNIKNLLMNQNFVAGLGNIYCSEILYDAKINPKENL